MPTTTKVRRDVKYLNKDFGSFRNDLIEFAKIYFPQTYNDFNESSPGMMFIEMASYVGDVLSYYIDNQFKESLLAFAEEKRVVFEMAQALGYKPKVTVPASTTLSVFQTVPATGNADNVKPDLNYGLTVLKNMEVSSATGKSFRTLEDCNFKFSSSYDPMEVTVYETDPSTNLPSKYLLKKKVKASSGTVTTEYFTFTDAEKYPRIALAKENVIEVVSVTDSDGNEWREVPFLAQDTVFDDIENYSSTDPELSQYSNDAPYLLKLVKTPRRFTTFVRSDDKSELRFGAGISDNPDEEIIPNPDNVGSSLPGSPSYLDTSFDPSNFLSTKAYGLSPSNTTLTVTYAYGGGVDDNLGQGELTSISKVSYNIDDENLTASLVQDAKDSVSVTNEISATGGKSAESTIEVKQNALAYFQAQQRAVTKPDYIVRAYSLPPKYGNIAKVYLVQDDQLNTGKDNISDPDAFIQESDVGKQVKSLVDRIPNPLALNMYTLGFNADKKLTTLNDAVKQNLKLYLGQYRMITDAVNIKDAWTINIGVKFSIITKRNYNKGDVLIRCIEEVKNFFNIDKWQINQPIVLSDLLYQLTLVEGVQSVVSPDSDNTSKSPIVITNKWKVADGYSGNIYDIDSATKNSVIYPSVDPSIFEIKYPNTDIEAKVVGSI